MKKLALSVCISAILVGCGGSGGSDPKPEPKPAPVKDQVVSVSLVSTDLFSGQELAMTFDVSALPFSSEQELLRDLYKPRLFKSDGSDIGTVQVPNNASSFTNKAGEKVSEAEFKKILSLGCRYEDGTQVDAPIIARDVESLGNGYHIVYTENLKLNVKNQQCTAQKVEEKYLVDSSKKAWPLDTSELDKEGEYNILPAKSLYNSTGTPLFVTGSEDNSDPSQNAKVFSIGIPTDKLEMVKVKEVFSKAPKIDSILYRELSYSGQYLAFRDRESNHVVINAVTNEEVEISKFNWNSLFVPFALENGEMVTLDIARNESDPKETSKNIIANVLAKDSSVDSQIFKGAQSSGIVSSNDLEVIADYTVQLNEGSRQVLVLKNSSVVIFDPSNQGSELELTIVNNTMLSDDEKVLSSVLTDVANIPAVAVVTNKKRYQLVLNRESFDKDAYNLRVDGKLLNPIEAGMVRLTKRGDTFITQMDTVTPESSSLSFSSYKIDESGRRTDRELVTESNKPVAVFFSSK